MKIDNVDAARPQTGLGAAEIVYVEPVEYGLTRLLAVYPADDKSALPEVLGPVRSARITDIDLVAQFGEPTFVYSGAADEVLDALGRAPLVNATELDTPAVFYREQSRDAPHNLYLRPDQVPAPARPPRDEVIERGPLRADGEAAAQYRVDFDAASYEFTWSAEQGRWLISIDGAPMESTDSGQLGAGSIAVQRVRMGTDPIGSPVAETIGTGEVTVLRDGQRFEGQWKRPSPQAATRFVAADGSGIPLGDGPVWIVLVPK